MKYVMFQTTDKSFVQRIPVIFPNSLVHALVADYVGVALREHGLGVKVVSAGEITWHVNGVHCSGKSTTLQVRSLPSDARIIEGYEYWHGIVDEEDAKEELEMVNRPDRDDNNGNAPLIDDENDVAASAATELGFNPDAQKFLDRILADPYSLSCDQGRHNECSGFWDADRQHECLCDCHKNISLKCGDSATNGG